MPDQDTAFPPSNTLIAVWLCATIPVAGSVLGVSLSEKKQAPGGFGGGGFGGAALHAGLHAGGGRACFMCTCHAEGDRGGATALRPVTAWHARCLALQVAVAAMGEAGVVTDTVRVGTTMRCAVHGRSRGCALSRPHARCSWGGLG